jgi:hypothetical protein
MSDKPVKSIISTQPRVAKSNAYANLASCFGSKQDGSSFKQNGQDCSQSNQICQNGSGSNQDGSGVNLNSQKSSGSKKSGSSLNQKTKKSKSKNQNSLITKTNQIEYKSSKKTPQLRIDDEYAPATKTMVINKKEKKNLQA